MEMKATRSRQKQKGRLSQQILLGKMASHKMLFMGQEKGGIKNYTQSKGREFSSQSHF
jgi:hypothetical protein